MTCKEIYNLHAFRAKESDLHDAYWDVPLDSRDETHKNNTSLHTACYFADITAVGILLDRGMDVNVKMMTATHHCAFWQDATLV